jgi:hypothetical protein
MFRAMRNLFLLTLFVGLAGAAIYALSLVNSHTYLLEVRQGQLVVLKGKMMPTGADPWNPTDPALVDAYAPIDLEGNNVLVAGQKFTERDELDRALFGVLEMLAKPRVASDAPKDLDKALIYVKRGEKLKGLSEDQRVALKKLQADLAFFLAQQRLDDARVQLEEALAQLKIAAESDSRHKAEATVMQLAVEPQVKLLATTLKATTAMAKSTGQNPQLDTLLKALEPQLKEVFQGLQKPSPAPDEKKPEPITVDEKKPDEKTQADKPVDSETVTRP